MAFIKVTAKHISSNRRVLGELARGKRRALYRVGGLIKQIAKRSIRKKRQGKFGKPSRPGSPPKSITHGLRNSFEFKVMDDDSSVIIGPIRKSTPNNVANLHEEGGTVAGRAGRVPIHKRAVRKGVKWKEGEEPYPSNRYPDHMMVLMPARRKYPERKFMGPAATKAQDKYPDIFKDLLRSGL